MLAEFFEFDQKMIHEKYKSVVEGLEADWEDLNRQAQAYFTGPKPGATISPIRKTFNRNLNTRLLSLYTENLYGKKAPFFKPIFVVLDVIILLQKVFTRWNNNL
jgi:hypothetical protein